MQAYSKNLPIEHKEEESVWKRDYLQQATKNKRNKENLDKNTKIRFFLFLESSFNFLMDRKQQRQRQ